MPPKKSASPSVRASSSQPTTAAKKTTKKSTKKTTTLASASITNPSAQSYDEGRQLAEQAFLGFGRLNLLEDDAHNPDAQWVETKFEWATFNNRPALDGDVKKMTKFLVEKPEFDAQKTAMNIPVEKAWFSAGNLQQINNCRKVEWSNAAISSIPAVRLNYESITNHAIKPYSGNHRRKAIQKSAVIVLQYIASCKALLDEDDLESIPDVIEETPARPSNVQNSINHWSTILEYFQGWPVAFYDQAFIQQLPTRQKHAVQDYLSQNAMNATVNEGEIEVQSRVLREVEYAFDDECVRLAKVHADLVEENLWDENCSDVISLATIAAQTKGLALSLIAERQEGKASTLAGKGTDVFTRLQHPLPRIAIGLFGSIGEAYTRKALTTTWASTKMMPIAMGHIAVYMTHMYTLMLCISSSDRAKERFPSRVAVEKALEDDALTGQHAAKHAATRAAAKLWFPFMPGGITMWVSRVVDFLDGCFSDSFIDSKTGGLFADFGSTAEGSPHFSRWKHYRSEVITSFDAYFKQHSTPDDVQGSFMARLIWFLSNEASDYHHFLPFPSPTCLELVGKQLRECDHGLVELHRSIDPFSHRMRGHTRADKVSDRLSPVDSATIFYEAIIRHPSLQPLNAASQAALCMKVLAFVIYSSRSGGELQSAKGYLEGLISEHQAIAIPVWMERVIKKGMALPGAKKKGDPINHDAVETFLAKSELSPSEWHRLVHDCEAVWAPMPQSTVDVSHATVKTSLGTLPPEADAEPQLTESERTIVQHIINVTDPNIAGARLTESLIVCSALASIILFVRGPAYQIYTECTAMMTVRAGFMALFQDKPFTFFDGFNDIRVVSEQDQLRVQNEMHQRETLHALDKCLQEIGKVTLSTLTDRAGEPIPEVYALTLKYIQDLATVVATANNFTKDATAHAPQALLDMLGPNNQPSSSNLIRHGESNTPRKDISDDSGGRPPLSVERPSPPDIQRSPEPVAQPAPAKSSEKNKPLRVTSNNENVPTPPNDHQSSVPPTSSSLPAALSKQPIDHPAKPPTKTVHRPIVTDDESDADTSSASLVRMPPPRPDYFAPDNTFTSFTTDNVHVDIDVPAVDSPSSNDDVPLPDDIVRPKTANKPSRGISRHPSKQKGTSPAVDLPPSNDDLQLPQETLPPKTANQLSRTRRKYGDITESRHPIGSRTSPADPPTSPVASSSSATLPKVANATKARPTSRSKPALAVGGKRVARTGGTKVVDVNEDEL